jgi:arsenical pump membrane protein
MAPVLLVVLAVEYAVLRVVFRRELSAPLADGGDVAAPPVALFPAVVVLLMLAAFAVSSPFGVEPFVVSTAAALALVALATALANLLTNFTATLLLVPLVATLGDTAVLAALLGLNIGAGLTYGGSLANLLWARHLGRFKDHPDLWRFRRASLAVTPVSLAAAATALWLVT